MTRNQKIGVGVGLGLTSLAFWFLIRRYKHQGGSVPVTVLPVPGDPPLLPPPAPVFTASPVGSWFQTCSSSGVMDPKPGPVPLKAELQDSGEISQVLNEIMLLYGLSIAKNVERIFRQETGHFKSGQYLFTGSAGMIPVAKTFPYGWGSMEKLWRDNPETAPVGVVRFCVGGKIFPYLAFSGFNGFLPVAEKLKANGNNPGRWNSNDPAEIQNYNNAINKLTATLI